MTKTSRVQIRFFLKKNLKNLDFRLTVTAMGIAIGIPFPDRFSIQKSRD